MREHCFIDQPSDSALLCVHGGFISRYAGKKNLMNMTMSLPAMRRLVFFTEIKQTMSTKNSSWLSEGHSGGVACDPSGSPTTPATLPKNEEEKKASQFRKFQR